MPRSKQSQSFYQILLNHGVSEKAAQHILDFYGATKDDKQEGCIR